MRYRQRCAPVSKTTEGSAASTVPAKVRGAIEKRIWFLWLQGIDAAPPLVQRCLESWRFWNPGWKVELLDETRLPTLLPEDGVRLERWSRLSPPARSDLIRLNLLCRHGGVWTDATCLCRRPLDVWLPPLLKGGFFAFDAPTRRNPLSTWFLASEPGGALIRGWRDAANAYWEIGTERTPVSIRELSKHPDYAEHRRDTSLWLDPERPEFRTLYPYFWVHYLFSDLLRDPKSAARWQAVPKITADIPHRLQSLGLQSPIDSALAREFRQGMAPLYKLSNKRNIDIDDHSTLLGYALDPSNW